MCRLHYLMLETPRRGEIERFYGDQLGMRSAPLAAPHGTHGSDVVLRVAARDRQLLFVDGDGCGLVEAGFAVEPARWASAQSLLGGLGAVDAPASPLLDGPALALADPDGNRLLFGERRAHTAGAVDAPLRAPVPAPDGRALPGRLQHFGLGTSRVVEMSAFYVDALRFAPSDRVYSDAGALRSTFVRSDAEHHSVAIFDNGKPGFDHLSFEAPDWNALRDWSDHFARFGTRLHWGPGRHGVGNNLFVFVLDPDGRMVEISAELDTLADDAPVGRWTFDYRAYNLWGAAAIRV